MKRKTLLALATLLSSTSLLAQVPASQEPFHPVVFQNKFIRILDVVLKPKDTSQFHIHSLPSLFVYFTQTNIALQTKGKDWVKQQSKVGMARYTAYFPDTLIHRVTNIDTSSFHVNDIEILSPYNPESSTQGKPLDLPLLFENDKSFAYQLSNPEMKKETVTTARGPMIAELITGDNVVINYPETNKSENVKAGQFLYIDPNTSFYFTSGGTSKVNLILFEIR